MRWECWKRFPCHRIRWKPLVSDPGMHHGTCATYVSWCMSGSLTRGKTFLAFPAHAQPAILPIWQETHVVRDKPTQCMCFVSILCHATVLQQSEANLMIYHLPQLTVAREIYNSIMIRIAYSALAYVVVMRCDIMMQDVEISAIKHTFGTAENNALLSGQENRHVWQKFCGK